MTKHKVGHFEWAFGLPKGIVVLSKIPTNRLREMLPNLISKSQIMPFTSMRSRYFKIMFLYLSWSMSNITWDKGMGQHKFDNRHRHFFHDLKGYLNYIKWKESMWSFFGVSISRKINKRCKKFMWTIHDFLLRLCSILKG